MSPALIACKWFVLMALVRVHLSIAMLFFTCVLFNKYVVLITLVGITWKIVLLSSLVLLLWLDVRIKYVLIIALIFQISKPSLFIIEHLTLLSCLLLIILTLTLFHICYIVRTANSLMIIHIVVLLLHVNKVKSDVSILHAKTPLRIAFKTLVLKLCLNVGMLNVSLTILSVLLFPHVLKKNQSNVPMDNVLKVLKNVRNSSLVLPNYLIDATMENVG